MIILRNKEFSDKEDKNIKDVKTAGRVAGAAGMASGGVGLYHSLKAQKIADKANSNGIGDKEPSEAKIKTEAFKDEIISKLDTSKSENTPKTIRRRLGKLIENAQKLNGAQKNNLKPNGTPKQNELYIKNVQQMVKQMKHDADFVGCGLSVVQDSKTGLYKLCIDNKLYDIPERKVEMGTDNTEDGLELVPVIVD